jgi:hypothetical protein
MTEIDLKKITISGKYDKTIYVESNDGKLFGERKEFRMLVVNNPTIKKPPMNGKTYSMQLTDEQDHYVLGVELFFHTTNPDGSLSFTNEK